MNQQKVIRNVLIVVAVLIIVGLILFFVLKKKKDTTPPAPTATPQAGGATSAPPVGSSNSFPLTLGSKGPLVKTLQQEMNKVIDKLDANNINAYGLKKLVTDGDWGQKTQYVFKNLALMMGISLTSINNQSQYNAVINACQAYVGSDNAQPQGFNGLVDFLNFYYS